MSPEKNHNDGSGRNAGPDVDRNLFTTKFGSSHVQFDGRLT